MIIRINGRVLEEKQPETEQVQKVKTEAFTWHITPARKPQDARKERPEGESLRERFNRVVKPILKPAFPVINLLAGAPVYAMGNQYNVGTMPVAAAAGQAAVGAGLAGALQPIIGMLQELALPVGIGMAIWGLIEVMVGNPGGRDKIKWAIISYCGVFIIPFFFYQIRGAFGGIPML